jgi:hypothetical protein
MRKPLIVALLLAASIGTAAAQQSPLVGVWQHSEPAGPGGPGTTMIVHFMPDDTFESRLAIPPTPQGGGGFIVTTGRYRMTGPDTYDSIADQALMCPAGMGCGPYPPGAPSLGLGQMLHFNFRLFAVSGG